MICWGKRLEAWRWGLDEVLVKINASVVSRFIYIILCTFPLCFPTKDQRLWFAKVCFLLSFFSSYKKFDLRFDGEIVKNYLTRLPSLFMVVLGLCFDEFNLFLDVILDFGTCMSIEAVSFL